MARIDEHTALLNRDIQNSENNISTYHEEDADTGAQGNETRVLQGTNAAFQRPWHRDKRWWVRLPAQVWQATGQRFISQVRPFEVTLPSLYECQPPDMWS